MAFCYILFSQKLNRFYIGATQGNLEDRIEKHNTRSYGNHRFTAKADDWELFLSIDCISYKQARNIELHIKKMKSTTNIKNFVKYPEIIGKLKSIYN